MDEAQGLSASVDELHKGIFVVKNRRGGFQEPLADQPLGQYKIAIIQVAELVSKGGPNDSDCRSAGALAPPFKTVISALE
jgi:hypothetical protein